MLNRMNLPFTDCLMMICLLIGSLGSRETLTNLIAKFCRLPPSLQGIFSAINSSFIAWHFSTDLQVKKDIVTLLYHGTLRGTVSLHPITKAWPVKAGLKKNLLRMCLILSICLKPMNSMGTMQVVTFKQ